MKRTVTEQDFRMPEYRDAKPDDYEFRADGKLVRKDRWEQGMRAVAQVLGIESREGFEIEDIVRQVAELVAAQPDGMTEWRGGECPVKAKEHIAVLLRNGDMLVGYGAEYQWSHNGSGTDIVAYRRMGK